MTGDAPRDRERAVSDLVGFAGVFGIVIISIALVFTLGVGALEDVQRSEGVENVERAFDIVADNIADIHRNGAPARSTELDLEVGQLSLSGSVRMRINSSRTPNGSEVIVTPVAYTSDRNGFYYTSGAVIRTTRGASVMVREPPFRFSEERVVISFVDTTRSGGTTSISGSSFRLRARRGVVPIDPIRQTGGVTLNLTVTSPRYSAWQQYFERDVGCSDVSVDPQNDTVVCRYTTESLYVRATGIEVSLTP